MALFSLTQVPLAPRCACNGPPISTIGNSRPSRSVCVCCVKPAFGGEAIRNLLSGVTTVSHHSPYLPQIFETDVPVHVLSEYGWLHCCVLSLIRSVTRVLSSNTARLAVHRPSGRRNRPSFTEGRIELLSPSRAERISSELKLGMKWIFIDGVKRPLHSSVQK